MAVFRKEQVEKKTQAGKHKPKGTRSEAGKLNHWSKYWVLKNPNNKTIEGWNLIQIIRDNRHLFEEKDLLPLSSTGQICGRCNAAAGLNSLGRKKDTRHSWKGWSLVEKIEGAEAEAKYPRQ